jgi:diguanylate cyclase (GGDEF)-like protein
VDRLLVVEDSPFFRNIIVAGFAEEQGITVDAVGSRAEALDALDAATTPYALGLIDLRLPDALDGEVVTDVLERGIPTVVFTSRYDEDLRERLLGAGVLDVVLKDSPASLRYLLGVTRRVLRNRHIRVVVADDSSTARRVCTDLLRRYQLDVLEARDGEEALALVLADPTIRLVVTDHEMPRMDGFELVTAIRRNHDRDAIAVIGVSGRGGALLSARFLKHGASDFLAKPYLPEELYTRVALHLDRLEDVAALRQAASHDPLTGLRNRRSLLEVAVAELRGARRAGRSVAVAMLDIDHFKAVNDTAGHDAGDDVLVAVAGVIEERALAHGGTSGRMGGEEFAVVLDVERDGDVTPVLEELRAAVEALRVDTRSGPLEVTLSIGVAVDHDGEADLHQLLVAADDLLYAAKGAGRNRVVTSAAKGSDAAPAAVTAIVGSGV